MSGVRVYTEYGTFLYPDAECYDNDELGTLDVNDADGGYLATFNVGQWSHIEYVDDVDDDESQTEDSKPRVWKSIYDVPRDGTVVADNDGDLFSWVADVLTYHPLRDVKRTTVWSRIPDGIDEDLGPLTEHLESK